MTFESAQELLESQDKNYASDTQFAVRRGLQLMEKYGEFSPEASHDVIYGIGFQEDMAEMDILQLNRLGWRLDEDTECWAIFV